MLFRCYFSDPKEALPNFDITLTDWNSLWSFSISLVCTKKGLWIQKYLRRIHLQEPPTSIDPLLIQPTVHVIGKSSDLRLFTQFPCVPWETYALQLTHKQLGVRSCNLKHQEMPQAESVGFHRQYSSSLLLLHYLRQLQHLVFHQGDKRTDHNSCTSSENRRKLVAQAFSVALKKKGRTQTSCFLCSYNVQLQKTILTPCWAPLLPRQRMIFCYRGTNMQDKYS